LTKNESKTEIEDTNKIQSINTTKGVNDSNENYTLISTTIPILSIENAIEPSKPGFFSIFDRYTLILAVAFLIGLLLISAAIALVICLCRTCRVSRPKPSEIEMINPIYKERKSPSLRHENEHHQYQQQQHEQQQELNENRKITDKDLNTQETSEAEETEVTLVPSQSKNETTIDENEPLVLPPLVNIKLQATPTKSQLNLTAQRNSYIKKSQENQLATDETTRLIENPTSDTSGTILASQNKPNYRRSGVVEDLVMKRTKSQIDSELLRASKCGSQISLDFKKIEQEMELIDVETEKFDTGEVSVKNSLSNIYRELLKQKYEDSGQIKDHAKSIQTETSEKSCY
jgi:hypothetical protein